MQLRYSKAALKALARLDKRLRDRVIAGIGGLTHNPPEGDIKPLAGRDGQYRLRIGGYRVIYQPDDGTINILDIGSRGDIYK